jgi:deoxyribose-phosphate aldolase
MNIASLIDHTALKASTSRDDVTRLCDEALMHRFAAVCVPPIYVSEAVEVLAGSAVKTATVIGFPFGYTFSDIKKAEAGKALDHGAQELDMVVNIPALKNGDWKEVEADIARVMEVVRERTAALKVIIESGILTDAEIIECCAICAAQGVHFVKTSTGYAESGASIAAVQLIRAHLPSGMRIKASGGIKTFAFARSLVEAGADRIGCSASIAIVSEASRASGENNS